MHRAAALSGLALGALLGAAAAAHAGVVFETYTDRPAFEARLGSVQVIDFDDIDTSQQDPAAFAADRYEAATGAVITGATDEGQYASRGFGFPGEFDAVSNPNVFAPGPISAVTGTNTTTRVTFSDGGAPGVVAGFGAFFIDADFPQLGPSSLGVFDADGGFLAEIDPISGGNGSQLFRGIVAVDDVTDQPIAAIGSAQLVSGDEFPSVDVSEGVVLDDFVFSTVPEPSGPLLLAAAAVALACRARLLRRG